MVGKKFLKTKNKNLNKENRPDVEWVSLPPEIFAKAHSRTPETSPRTSLRSVADYLLDTEEKPARKANRKSCWSPDFSKAIAIAEDLVEDAEKLISEISRSAFTTDYEDVGRTENGFEKNQVNHNYIKNIVASTLKQNHGKPEPSSMFDTQKLLSEINPPPTGTNHPQNPRLNQKVSLSTQKLYDRVNFKPSAESCEVCKLSKKNFHESKTVQTESTETKEVQSPVKEKPEKLNVQKGPVISIKGDLSVQSSGIIDIQPVENASQISSDIQANTGTFKICHSSSGREQISSLSIAKSDNSKSLQEGAESANIEKSSGAISKQDFSKTDPKQVTQPDRILNNHLQVLKENSIVSTNVLTLKEKNFDFGKDVEEIDLDFGDFSLPEPQILTEADFILDQQRKIIRRMDDTTRKFDKFLEKRFPEEITSEPDDRENYSKEHFKKYHKTKKNYTNKDKLKKPAPKSQNIDFLSEINHVYSELKSSVTSHSLENCEIDKYQKDDCQNGKMSNVFEDSTKSSDYFDVLAVESKKVPSDSPKESLDETIKKVVEYKVTESGATSYSESEVPSSEKSNTELQEKQSDDEDSQNTSLPTSSVYNPMASNSGSISKSKISQTSKGNDSNVNLTDDNSSVGVNTCTVDTKKEDLKVSNERSVDATDTVENRKKVYKNNVDIKNVREPDLVGKKLKLFQTGGKIVEERIKSTTEIRSCEESSRNSREENDSSRKKEQDYSKETSQETSELIEDLKNIDFTSEDSSLQFSFVINDSEVTDVSSKTKKFKIESTVENKIGSTENNKSKDFQAKIKTFSEKSNQTSVNLEKSPNNITTGAYNPVTPKNDQGINYSTQRVQDIESIYLNNTSHHPSVNSRSCMSMLVENSSCLQESLQKHRSNLLKKLESCSIPLINQEKQLFSSTAYGDNEAYHFNTKRKLWSESSSDTHSEGEVRVNSSASYSLGEVKRKNNSSESSLFTQVPSISDSQQPSMEQL